ncbi:hypothetical protein F4818DRAFT_274384 [Hypoxylon cercidicola]|nr:hypothetical protein F4818DRAFT_274384 [Hypoxylon cercidicola]
MQLHDQRRHSQRYVAPLHQRWRLVRKGTRSVLLHLSADVTANLEVRRHQLDIELGAAIHAAVTAIAYSIANPTSNQKPHTSTMRQSLRPCLPAPYDGVAGAAGLYTAGYMVTVPATQSWLENARQYHAEYAEVATPDLLGSRCQYALAMRSNMKGASAPNPPLSGLDFSYVARRARY